jgi:hypothetical protein
MHTTPTQNLNAKLVRMQRGRRHLAGGGLGFPSSAIHSSSPPNRIVGATARYRGGYHLSI